MVDLFYVGLYIIISVLVVSYAVFFNRYLGRLVAYKSGTRWRAILVFLFGSALAVAFFVLLVPVLVYTVLFLDGVSYLFPDWSKLPVVLAVVFSLEIAASLAAVGVLRLLPLGRYVAPDERRT